MSFNPGQAMVIDSLERIRMVGSAFKKTGKPVVLVPLGAGVHAGHIALVRAAKRVRGAVVVVALNSAQDKDVDYLKAEGVDVVFSYTEHMLWPHDLRVQLRAKEHGLEPAEDLSRELARVVALINSVGPSHVIAGEKDYELLVGLQTVVNDLHLPVRIQGVPTVRTPEGIAMSLRNVDVPEGEREKASALSAALTAGAYAAEAGADKVREVAQSVLDAACVTPEYLEVRGRDLGEPPAEGDARLLVAATIGGVRLCDNVGLPLGIGFNNLEEYEAKAELEREEQRQFPQ